MRPARARARLLALAVVTAGLGCDESPGSGGPAPKERQHDLAQGILAWAQASARAPADVRADVSLALAEVATRDHASRLRLIAADDANPFHDAAGLALARVRALRAEDALSELESCGRSETLEPVQLGCLQELRDRSPERFTRLVTPLLAQPANVTLVARSLAAGSPQPGPWRPALLSALDALPETARSTPEAVRARDALLAPSPLVAPANADAVLDALGSSELETQRQAVRALLLVRDTFRSDERVETALLLATRRDDARLRHLVEAVFLRRSLVDAKEKAATKPR